MMTDRQSEAIASLCLMAAFADGSKTDTERERLKGIFEALEGPDHTTVYQRVLLKRATLESEAAALDTAELRTLAYEMAVGVCDADGRTSEAERAFLDRLAGALGIAPDEGARVLAQAEAIAEPDLETPLAAITGATAIATATAPSAPSGPVDAAVDTTRDKAVDDMILRTSMLCGGLELLPQNMATLGIVPLQTKLVHDVGHSYGYQLDRGHITEFIAVIGAGMTSQLVEGYARKFLGKLAKRHLGKMAGGLASTATGAAMSFASTWAIGQVARQYYAGGRKLSAIDLQRLYTESLGRGQQVYAEQAASRGTGAFAPLSPAGGIGSGMAASPGFAGLEQLFGMLKGR